MRPPWTARPLGLRAFAARCARAGVALDRATQLLYDAQRVYANGAEHAWPRPGAPLIRRLADHRALAAAECRATGARRGLHHRRRHPLGAL